MSLAKNVLYPLVLVTVAWVAAVLSLQVNENGIADFSDEDESQTAIFANFKGITAFNTTSLAHLTALEVLSLSGNQLKQIPVLAPVANSLKVLFLDNNPSLEKARNEDLAVLKRLKTIDVTGTGITVLTSTCPGDSEEHVLQTNADGLDLCDCQHAWLKVR